MGGAAVTEVLMARALGTGVSPTLRTMGLPAACGKEMEEMMEAVVGMEAPEEDTEAAGGPSLLLLLSIIIPGERLNVPMDQCRVDGHLLNPRKAAAAAQAVEEVVALVHGVVRAL